MLNIPNTDRIDQSARTIGRKENGKEKKKDKRAISERALCQKKEKIALHFAVSPAAITAAIILSHQFINYRSMNPLSV